MTPSEVDWQFWNLGLWQWRATPTRNASVISDRWYVCIFLQKLQHGFLPMGGFGDTLSAVTTKHLLGFLGQKFLLPLSQIASPKVFVD